MKCLHFPYDDNKQEQLLLYIGGESATGKSQVIHGICPGLKLLNRKQEIMLMGPTSVAKASDIETCFLRSERYEFSGV